MIVQNLFAGLTGLPGPENKKCQTACQIRPNSLKKGQLCQLLTVLKFLNIHMNFGIEAMLAGLYVGIIRKKTKENHKKNLFIGLLCIHF